jgi:hypothetical protein
MAHLNKFHPSNNDFIRLVVLIVILMIVLLSVISNADSIIDLLTA